MSAILRCCGGQICANMRLMGQRVNRLPSALLSSSFSVLTQANVSPMFPHRWAAVHPQVPCLKRASACCSSSSATSLGVNLTVLAGKQSSTWGVLEMKGGKGDEKRRALQEIHTCADSVQKGEIVMLKIVVLWQLPTSWVEVCHVLSVSQLLQSGLQASSVSCWLKYKNPSF